METIPLEIRLFGRFEVLALGQPIRRLRTRSVEWLLALLTLRPGRDVSRSWLAGALWPESDETQALVNLRRNLVDLRQALGAEAGRLRTPNRRTISFDLKDVTSDVLQFDQLMAQGDESSLEAALRLHRGLLLEGCTEPWVLPEREARTRACIKALETLADRASARGDTGTAAVYLRRSEVLNPLCDSTQRRIIRVLAESGDAAGAVNAYREYRVKLHREMNIEPEEETSRLFRSIRDSVRRSPGGLTRTAPGKTSRMAVGEAPEPLISRTAPCELPRPLTPLIGRECEVSETMAQVRCGRLVTLVGAGGIGKTRLAIQVAEALSDELPDGAVFVELASLNDPGLIPGAVAAAMRIPEESVSRGSLSITDLLAARLTDRSLLMVLDNCEHVIEAAARFVDSLLRSCPRLRILVTSREPLRLPGEVVRRVSSLSVPDLRQLPSDEDERRQELLRSPAVSLFVERATMADSGFSLSGSDALVVGEICHQLDGIPLAIELAAARARVLTVRQIAEGMSDQLRLLAGGSRTALSRHQTLQALIDWSYNLLSEDHRALLRCLSVFAGGWTFEAAEAVCRDAPAAGGDTLDRLTSLVDRSLILVSSKEGQARYRILDTIRQYARKKLAEKDEEAAMRTRHLVYFQMLAENLQPGLWGPGREAALATLDAEYENLRDALAWGRVSDPEAHLRLAGALAQLWELRGLFAEGAEHLGWALGNAAGSPIDRARPLLGASQIARAQYRFREARVLAGESAQLYREHGDIQGMARALSAAGAAALYEREFEIAQSFLEESLFFFRQCGSLYGEADARRWLAILAGHIQSPIRDPYAARSLHLRVLDLARELRDQELLASCLRSLASLDAEMDDPGLAQARLEESLAICEELGNKRTIADTLNSLADLASSHNDWVLAQGYYERSVAIRRELGQEHRLAWSLLMLGDAFYYQQQFTLARQAGEEAVVIFRRLRDAPGAACARNNLGCVALRQGDYARARALHDEALMAYRDTGWVEGVTWSIQRLALVEQARGKTVRAVTLMGAGEALRETLHVAIPAAEWAEYQTCIADLRAALDEQTFLAAWARGRLLRQSEAIRFALSQESIPGPADLDPARNHLESWRQTLNDKGRD